MGQLIIINAPTSFTAIWSMIKPWLAPRTLDKITILGTNSPDQHTALLLDLVSPENLPASLGGTCTCTCTCASTTSSSTRGDDRDSESSGSDSGESDSSGGDGGCALSNAGPWMDGRAERRARWLRGEIPGPGVPWPPLQKDEKEKKERDQGPGTEETREETEEDGASQTAAVSSPGAPSASTSSPSCARASVVGLPLPLQHPPPPAAVRLVV
jgi:hypothetical protein